MDTPTSEQKPNICAHPKAATFAALTQKEFDKLDNAFESVLNMVADAATQSAIGTAHGNVPQALVSRWMHSLTGERLQRLIEARKSAGLVCLDKGLAALEEAKGGEMNEITWAKAMEQHWARRSGVFNRELSEKYAPPPQAPAMQQIPSFSINIISNNPQGVTIDQTPDMIEDADLI